MATNEDEPSVSSSGSYPALQWREEPPDDGTFFYVQHERMSPTMAMRLGDDLVLFGESVVQGGRSFDEMPAGTEYWGPLPEPKTEAESAG